MVFPRRWLHTVYVNFRLASETLFVRIPLHPTTATTMVPFCPLPSFTPSMIYLKHFAYESHRQISRRIRCEPVNGKEDVVFVVPGKISRFVLWIQITFFQFEYRLHQHAMPAFAISFICDFLATFAIPLNTNVPKHGEKMNVRFEIQKYRRRHNRCKCKCVIV